MGTQLYLTPEEAICTCQKIEISEHVKHILRGQLFNYVFFFQQMACSA